MRGWRICQGVDGRGHSKSEDYIWGFDSHDLYAHGIDSHGDVGVSVRGCGHGMNECGSVHGWSVSDLHVHADDHHESARENDHAHDERARRPEFQ